MLRRAAALGTLLTVGAASASLAGEAPLLADWARTDGKTRIRVASRGAAICARNGWITRRAGEPETPGIRSHRATNKSTPATTSVPIETR